MSEMASPTGANARGFVRLLDHCARFERLTSAARASGHDRLEAVVGGELARSLVHALAGEHSLKGRFYTPDPA